MWLYGQPWFLDFDVLGTSMRTLFRVHTINVSVALWVGMIALVGVAGDNGVVLATYLKQRFAESPPDTIDGVRELAFEGGMRRVRPCLMVTAITFLALMPVITSQGKGSDVMVPMALPLMGGMAIQLVTLFVVPVLYSWAEERRLRTAPVADDPEPEVAVREAAPEEPTDEEE
jgi:Cu(I)/Ag(I) efflux system membrane protein CusA/SilA